ncbi:Uma2 family endonuclease [Neolewinella persica]|uniref:Uma2 family endonuclease n=1 Tax=Neolewinella persica TaxID=70998 RepID=UPI0003627335|nr:Uma2 family endonuclease [Neolewinella persica]
MNSNDHVIGVQDPVTLLDNSEPEPDIYVAKGPLERYHNYHPGPEHLLLVIEVSDATLHRDKTAKYSAYAAAGIQEYWVIDVYNRVIFQYTKPNQVDGVYASENTYVEKDEFESLYLGKFSGRELILQLK